MSLRAGKPPLFEPGLQDAVREGLTRDTCASMAMLHPRRPPRSCGSRSTRRSTKMTARSLRVVLDYVGSLIDAVAPMVSS